MTLRERIADWISGGKLKRLRVWSKYLLLSCEDVDRKYLDEVIFRQELQARLDRIAAMETPRCAHIGKRMARVARGEE